MYKPCDDSVYTQRSTVKWMVCVCVCIAIALFTLYTIRKICVNCVCISNFIPSLSSLSLILLFLPFSLCSSSCLCVYVYLDLVKVKQNFLIISLHSVLFLGCIIWLLPLLLLLLDWCYTLNHWKYKCEKWTLRKRESGSKAIGHKMSIWEHLKTYQR